jgi:hypothetical protein
VASTFVAVAVAASAAGAIPNLLLIDEDSIDNSSPAVLELAALGICGAGIPAVCVNDQFANPGVRDPLNLPPGTILGNGVPGGTIAMLFTGQENDEGWFLVPTILQSWIDAGPTGDGAFNYLLATAPGFGMNGEFLLDKIPDVNPLDAAELESLVGQTFCAVVYDSDISINFNPLEGNLQGANYGVLALEVLAVGADPPGSVLPDITIRVLDPSVCGLGSTGTRVSTWGELKAIYR